MARSNIPNLRRGQAAERILSIVLGPDGDETRRATYRQQVECLRWRCFPWANDAQCAEAARLLLEVLGGRETLEQCHTIRLEVKRVGASAVVCYSGDGAAIYRETPRA